MGIQNYRFIAHKLPKQIILYFHVFKMLWERGGTCLATVWLLWAIPTCLTNWTSCCGVGRLVLFASSLRISKILASLCSTWSSHHLKQTCIIVADKMCWYSTRLPMWRSCLQLAFLIDCFELDFLHQFLLSFFVALDHSLGANPHPRPALPVCSHPMISWSYSQMTDWSTTFCCIPLLSRADLNHGVLKSAFRRVS